VIGEVIAEPVYRVTEGDRVVAEFPGSRLVTDCPVYTPDAREADAIRERRARDVSAIAERSEEADPAWTLRQMLASPTIASKRWVYRQYDSTVRTNSVIGPGGDASVLRLRGTHRGIAVKTDGNGRYVYLDPRVGGRIAVAEAARNVACTGARPMAITNCLNFGNPKKAETYFQLREAIFGIGDACRALGTPVTGGNVSLYNESPAGAVYPTPVIGMVGVLDDVSRAVGSFFREAGDAVVLLGEPTGEIGGSEYLYAIHGEVAGPPPACDLERERALVETLVECAGAGLLASAHDVSDGGFAVALVESAVGDDERHMGVDCDLGAWAALPLRGLLFGEGQGRVIVSTAEAEQVIRIARKHGLPAARIGSVRAAADGIRIVAGSRSIVVEAGECARIYHDSIAERMQAPAGAGAVQ
jgi:phosphoribosylformylglycinamidine synthase